MTVRHVLVKGLVMVALVACSGDRAPQPTATMRPLAPQAAPDAPQEMAALMDEEYRYDPEGKPDPFESFIRMSLNAEQDAASSPLERFDLSQLIVTGIVWATDNARALIEDPAGKGYIVAVGTSIGKNKGKVVKIEDNRVWVKETYVDFHDRATTKEVEMRLYDTQGG